MKKFLIIALGCILTIAAAAQDSFKVNQNDLIWQEIYTHSNTVNEVINNIRMNNYLSDIRVNNNTITCTIHPIAMPFQELGYSRGGVPMYVVLNNFTGYATIQIKEDRFRVTVERMTLISNSETISASSQGETIPLNFYSLRQGSINPQFLKKAGVIIDYMLDKIFTQKSLIDDNW